MLTLFSVEQSIAMYSFKAFRGFQHFIIATDAADASYDCVMEVVKTIF